MKHASLMPAARSYEDHNAAGGDRTPIQPHTARRPVIVPYVPREADTVDLTDSAIEWLTPEDRARFFEQFRQAGGRIRE